MFVIVPSVVKEVLGVELRQAPTTQVPEADEN